MNLSAAHLIAIEDRLSTLTEEIYSEVGSRELLADAQARAQAVARVQKLIARIVQAPLGVEAVAACDECEADIIFGRQDAEHAFRERAGDN